MIVDLTPVIQASVSLAALALGTVGTFALARLAQKLGIQTNSEAMANLTSAAMNVSTASLSKLQGTIARKGWDHPDVKNLTIAMAATALAAKFPDTLKAVGLDPSNDAVGVQAGINDVLERVFPAAVAQIAASPATPPADLTMATAPQPMPIVQAGPHPEQTLDVRPLVSAVSSLIASHETTNALLSTLVAQGSAPAADSASVSSVAAPALATTVVVPATTVPPPAVDGPAQVPAAA